MDSIDRRLVLAGAGLAGVAALSRMAKAGPLDPPQGPIAPTGKTLQQIHDKIARGGDIGTPEARTPVQSLTGSPTAQYVIMQPGVYYLTDNVTGEPGKCCIDVQADNVELECDGFCFNGVPGTLSCIRARSSPTAAPRCLGIYDAGFRGWQGQCVDAADCDDSLVEECWFDTCVSPVNADGTGGACCELGDGGVVYDCDVRRCQGCTIRVGRRGVIEECVCSDGTGGTPCFDSVGDCVMEDNFAQNCDGPAFTVGSRGIVLYNRCAGTNGGVDVGAASVVSENDIDLSPGSAANGITIRGPRCCVSENYVGGGGGGGGGIVVMVGGDGALIEGNHVVGAGAAGGSVGNGLIAVQQGVSRCHVTSNHIRGNSALSLQIPPGNSYGPPAIVPDAGDMSAVPAASHPWANFIY